MVTDRSRDAGIRSPQRRRGCPFVRLDADESGHEAGPSSQRGTMSEQRNTNDQGATNGLNRVGEPSYMLKQMPDCAGKWYAEN